MKKLICFLKINKYALFIFLITTAFVMIFASSTGIFRPDFYGWDSAAFMYIGKGMLHGYVPYRDLFDSKGPMLWLIEFLGQLVCEGRYGIHLLEIINLNLIMQLVFYSARLFLNEKKSCLTVILSLIFWAATLETGNAVEEFSALYSMIAVYFTLKSIRTDNGFLNGRLYIVYGLCFMAALLIRVIDCIIIVSCIIYAGLEIMRVKQMKRVVQCCAIAGISAAALLAPFVIYYAANGALNDWMDATVLFSIKYASFNKEAFDAEAGRRLTILILPFAVAVFGLVRKDRKLPVLLLIMTFLCAVLYAKIGTAYFHYMILAIPCVVLAIIYTLAVIPIGFNKHTAVVLFVFFLLNGYYCYTGVERACDNIEFILHDDIYDSALFEFSNEVNHIVGDNHRNSVYTDSVGTAIKLTGGFFSRSKYFNFQSQWRQNEERGNLIYEDFISGENYWVITTQEQLEQGDQRITQRLNEAYTQVYKKEQLLLYRLAQ